MGWILIGLLIFVGLLFNAQDRKWRRRRGLK